MTTLLLSQPLHFGDYGGMPLKILWALLDLLDHRGAGRAACICGSSAAAPSRAFPRSNAAGLAANGRNGSRAHERHERRAARSSLPPGSPSPASVGLVSALVGDGIFDAVSWTVFAALIGLALRAWLRRDRGR